MKSSRRRPDRASPSFTAGWTTSRRYFGLLNGCTCMPSQSSPATRHMYGFTAAMKIGMRGCSIGPGVEERRHHVEGVEAAVERELGPVLPAVPDGADRLDGLRHLGPGRLELHGEAPLVVRLDLGAQAEGEAPARGLLQVPRDVSGDHRAPRERGRDVRAELDARGHGGRHGQGQVGVVLGLRRPETVVAHGLDLPGELRRGLEVVGEHADVELHPGDLLWPGGGLSIAPRIRERAPRINRRAARLRAGPARR